MCLLLKSKNFDEHATFSDENTYICYERNKNRLIRKTMATLLLILVPAVSLFVLGYLVITAPEYREH
jgi:hypothetical protein